MHVVFLPQLTHGCSVWYTPHEEKGHLKGVARAWRAFSIEHKEQSLEPIDETHSPLMHIHLDHITCEAALRIATSPAYDAIVEVRFIGQQLWATLGQRYRQFINILRKKGTEIELHWVPAHIGIKGNKMADIAAKQATEWR